MTQEKTTEDKLKDEIRRLRNLGSDIYTFNEEGGLNINLHNKEYLSEVLDISTEIFDDWNTHESYHTLLEMIENKIEVKEAQLKGFQDGYQEGICKSTYPLAFQRGKKEAFIELFKKFDEFACIKDDKWYLDFKADKLKGETNDN